MVAGVVVAAPFARGRKTEGRPTPFRRIAPKAADRAAGSAYERRAIVMVRETG